MSNHPMLEFYRKASLMLIGLVLFTLVLALICWDLGFVRNALLPASDSVLPWKLETLTDAYRGGTSSITVNDSSRSLDYDYTLTEDVMTPHATVIVSFAERQGAARFIDLSEYVTVAFKLKCAPSNVLTFHLHTFDPRATDPKNFYSYRIAKAFFSCSEDWSNVEIDLRYLYVPEWWLNRFKIETSDQNYRRDKVVAFSIVASFEGPIDAPANIKTNVKISEMAFQGRHWRYAWPFGGLLVLVWMSFIFWLFKHYTRSLIANVKDKLQKDLALIAYRELSAEPQTDREKVLLLRFIATRYADPDLSLEKTSLALGIDRTKINEILKREVGLTFTACLNKLRLTEAARLLSENDSANVAEIAYTVGYSNVTYFGRVFKNEYGCSPKVFKKTDIGSGESS
jgi:AraC-like DNA-binding protein